VAKTPTPAEIRAILSRPILDEEALWRVDQTYQGRNGGPPRARLLAYIDARAGMARLDEAFGWDGWQDDCEMWGPHGVKCAITCRIKDKWYTRSGIGVNAREQRGDKGIAIKGGESDAFKRACVKWGIGRNLYSLPKTMVDVHQYKPKGVPECRLVNVYDSKKNIKGWSMAPSIRDLQRATLTINARVHHIEDSRDRRVQRMREACKDAVGAGMHLSMVPDLIMAASSFEGKDAFILGPDDPARLSNDALKVASHKIVTGVESDDGWNGLLRWLHEMRTKWHESPEPNVDTGGAA